MNKTLHFVRQAAWAHTDSVTSVWPTSTARAHRAADGRKLATLKYARSCGRRAPAPTWGVS